MQRRQFLKTAAVAAGAAAAGTGAALAELIRNEPQVEVAPFWPEHGIVGLHLEGVGWFPTNTWTYERYVSINRYWKTRHDEILVGYQPKDQMVTPLPEQQRSQIHRFHQNLIDWVGELTTPTLTVFDTRKMKWEVADECWVSFARIDLKPARIVMVFKPKCFIDKISKGDYLFATTKMSTDDLVARCYPEEYDGSKKLSQSSSRYPSNSDPRLWFPVG